MKDPLYSLTWVTAHKSGNKNCSNHKKRARANTSWQFLESVDLGKETLTIYNYQTLRGKNAFPLRESSKSEPDLNLKSHSKQPCQL